MNNKILKLEKTFDKFPGLVLEKYHNRVFYDNLWGDNPELVECRGRVRDKDGKVVINPFTKIFNRNENGTDIDKFIGCLAVEKVNGFMCAMTYVESAGDVVVSTTGSLDSDYTRLAETYLTNRIRRFITLYKDHTFLFEVCDPKDPHIIRQDQGLYLLGIRKTDEVSPYHSTLVKEMTFDKVAACMRVKRPNYFVDLFVNICKKAKTCNSEGYVVYPQEGNFHCLKLKTPLYLTTKALARIKDISKLSRKFINEEFYPLIDYFQKLTEFNNLPEQDRLLMIYAYYYGESE